MLEMKTRGKRKRGEAAPSGPGLRKPRGRPMKPASELRSSKSRQNFELRIRRQQQQKSQIQTQPVRVSSHLERLPVELIQQIFFHTLELSLAHTSYTLQHALSKDSIHRCLILLAFFDDDDKLPVETKHFLPFEYRSLKVEEKVRLQKSILKCDWCSLAKLKECMSVLSRLKMAQAWHVEQRLHQSLIGDGAARIVSPLLGAREDLAPLPALNDTEKLEQHFFARMNVLDVFGSASNANDMIENEHRSADNPYRAWIFTWSMDKGLESSATDLSPIVDHEVVHKFLDKSVSILGVRHIPNRLLCGNPWTVEKLEMLQLLRQGHRFIREDFVLAVSYPAMFKGMASAIEENNLKALKTLLELHYTISSRCGLACDFLANAPDKKKHLYAVRFERPLPLDLFHLAVTPPDPADPNQDLDTRTADLITLLLREGIDSIPLDDAILTRWALRNPSRVAKWLLHHMEVRQDYGVSSGRRSSAALFDNGALNDSCPAARFPFPHTSFTQELRYETFGALTFMPQNPQA